MNKVLIVVSSVLFLASSLTACGGGGGGGGAGTQAPPPVVNSVPIVDAGVDQEVYADLTVELSATASDSDGTVDSVSWTQIEGPAIALSDPSSLSTWFTAPSVDTDTVITLELTVTDNAGGTATDRITITILSRGNIPTAAAGNDELAIIGSSVTLDGSSSSDPDGDPLTYQWMIVSAPPLSTAVLNGADTLQPTFVPDVPGAYEIQLIVRDHVNESGSSVVIIIGCTELVGGIINGDVVLLASDSPYLMTGNLQIPFGSSLDIPPGTTIFGADNEIWVGGLLRAAGTADNIINLTDAHIRPATGPSTEFFSIELAFIHAIRGSIYRPTGHAIYGGLQLRDSIIEGLVGPIYIWYPRIESVIERSLFMRSTGISTGTDNTNVMVQNNAFLEQIGYAIENWASYGGSQTVVSRNSFLSQDRIALRLPSGYTDGRLDGAENYWGTTDTAIIDQMIFDANDDINSADVINYLPILAEPDPLTPKP